MCNRHVYPTAISTFTSDYTLLLNYHTSGGTVVLQTIYC